MRPSMRRFYSIPGRFKTTKSGRQQFRYDLVGKSEDHFATGAVLRVPHSGQISIADFALSTPARIIQGISLSEAWKARMNRRQHSTASTRSGAVSGSAQAGSPAALCESGHRLLLAGLPAEAADCGQRALAIDP